MSGDTADENLVDMGKGDNPLLVLSLAARRLGARNMFNASIINLESGVQVVGRSVNYERLDDGVETMGSLAQELTGVTIPGVAVLTPKPTSVPAPTSVPIPTPAPVPAPVLAPTSKPVPTPAPGKTVPSGLSLEDALTWLSSNAVEGGTYTITLKTNETIPPKTLAYGEKNVSLTLEGDTSERGIILNSPGALFTVEKGVSLILGAHVTLWGQSSNTASLVRVNSGGTLMMKAGSKITGNTMNSPSGNGGGVYVAGGTFTMKSGAISGNTSFSGGGVYVSSSSNSRFIKMPGAVIYGSNADSTLKNTARRNGQAVYVDTSPSKRHNATAGSGVSLDSSVNGAAGGWE